MLEALAGMALMKPIAKRAEAVTEKARKRFIKSLASLGSRGRKGKTLEKMKPPLRGVPRAAALSQALLSGRSPSVGEDRQVELVERRLVGDQIDGDDLPAHDREVENDAWLPARSPHGSHGSIHQRRLCDPGAS